MSPSPHQDSIDYGYGDAAPDVNRYQEPVCSQEAYGYEEASPDVSLRKNRRRWSMLASTATSEHGPMAGSGPLPRRSSLRQTGAPSKRRVSMGDEISVRLPGQPAPQVRRRSITFDHKVKVKSVEAISNMTEHPEALWFQTEEFSRIRRNSWDLVDKVERGRTGLGNRKYCIRGLERLLEREMIQKAKFTAWDTVFDEQDMQRDRGCWDEEYMAIVYRRTSINSAKAALLRGKQDEMEITKYLNSTRQMCRRLSC
eukprot:Nitzschia sp. Nitz4//scaffold201_size42423//33789//34553//NITZ4_007379-RA/size42423-processed-gene-0.15-mRNA-1//1//CDS//3329541347//8666//frame0